MSSILGNRKCQQHVQVPFLRAIWLRCVFRRIIIKIVKFMGVRMLYIRLVVCIYHI